MLSGRGFCDELITHPEESYRLLCIIVCDLDISRIRKSWPALGRRCVVCIVVLCILLCCVYCCVVCIVVLCVLLCCVYYCVCVYCCVEFCCVVCIVVVVLCLLL